MQWELRNSIQWDAAFSPDVVSVDGVYRDESTIAVGPLMPGRKPTTLS